MAFRKTIEAMIANSPLPALVRRRHRRELGILMFHGFTGNEHAQTNLEGKDVTVENWERFMTWLSKRHRILPLSEAVSFIERGKSLPDYSVCVTMDDGHRSTHELAFPVLEKMALPATIFLATAFVDEKRPIWVDRVTFSLTKAGKSLDELRQIKSALKHRTQDDIESAVAEVEAQTGFALPPRTDDPSMPQGCRSLDWDQISQMKSGGLVEFGSHTHMHRILGRCSETVVRDELVRSRRMIEQRLGGNCDLFCYPNGDKGDFTDATELLVREAGYRASFTTVTGWNAASASPFAMRRLGVYDSMDLNRFKLTVTGVMDLIFNRRRGN